MYAKVNNGVVEVYPYTIDDLRRDYPNTSFPNDFTPEVLRYLSMVRVIVTGCPDVDYTKTVSEGVPQFVSERNRWEQNWIVTDATAEEITARTDAKSSEIRSTRNAMLSSCDWTQVDDTPLSNSKKLEWAAYRQSLRDLTDQPGFPWNVTWPQEP